MKPLLPLSLLAASRLLAVGTDVVTEADLLSGAQDFGELRRGKSVDGNPLRLGGRTFESGLGTHAVSEIPVTVPAGAARFTGAAGVDDEVGAGKGSVKFRILSGEAVLWESPDMKAGDAPARFDIAVPSTRHRRIYLQADNLGGKDSDHADWVDLKWVRGAAPSANAPRVMQGAEFGLKPGADADQSPALRKALTALREAPGSTLKLAPGTYRFLNDGALRKHFHISNHEQPTWHAVSLPLVDLRHVTIDGQGALFLFDGSMQPVLIQDSEKVVIKGVAFDYATPHHSQGIVTKVDASAYELEVDPKKYPHEIKNGWFHFKGPGWETRDIGWGILFDGKTRAILAGSGDCNYQGKLTTLAEGRYRIEKNLAGAGLKPGDAITFRHDCWTARPHPAVMIYRSKDVALLNSPIHAAHGMALLAQRSENIRVSGGGVYPRKETGRFFSSNADADHFSNCRGAVIVENALFEGMMDDAINVHATCLRIEEKVDARTLRCKYVHGQAWGFETFLPGETLRFIEASHLSPGETRQVIAVRKLNGKELLITLDADAPESLGKGDAVENADWFPSVVFRGNTVRNNRARGSLFTTPKPVLVEKNRFEAIAGSAILLAGDANGWYESGGCHDVVIRDNYFRDNLTSRFQFTEGLIVAFPEVPDLKGQKEYYHRKVRIEHNTFETFDVPLVYAISTDGITFTNNKVNYNDHFPGWKKPPFILRRCANVVVENNAVTRRGAPVKWSAADAKSELTEPSAISIR